MNLFAQVGDYSDGFPPDVTQTLIDGFSVVVAHELNHNVENAAGRLYPWYWDRKYDLLEQASPPHLVFLNHNTLRFGLNLPATQSNFLAHGLWNGVAADWSAAYDQYWNTGPGAGFDRHWLRDNLKFCLDAPQEAFATLSNQYFTSSDVMLQLAIARWKQGITNCINQVLFFADVYSLGSNQTFFYRINTAAKVTRTQAALHRDTSEHIDGITAAATHYDFALDKEGNVLDLRGTPRNTPLPGFSIHLTQEAMFKLSLQTAPGFRLVVEESDDLRNWYQWQVYDPFAGVSNWEGSIDPLTHRFYRLRRDW